MFNKIQWTFRIIFSTPYFRFRFRFIEHCSQTANKKLSYRKESVRLLHNIEIRILH